MCIFPHVISNLELPVSEGGSSVSSGVSQSVGGGYEPDTQVDGEPSFPVVIGVTIECRGIAAENVTGLTNIFSVNFLLVKTLTNKN